MFDEGISLAGMQVPQHDVATRDGYLVGAATPGHIHPHPQNSGDEMEVVGRPDLVLVVLQNIHLLGRITRYAQKASLCSQHIAMINLRSIWCF
jgi:hypothetical protein